MMGATGVPGSPIAKMVRLLSDGGLDPTFSSVDNTINTQYYPAGVQSDGKILALRSKGQFEWTLFRFNTDGSRDATFTPIQFGSTYGLSVAITGYKQLAGGRFFLADNAGIFQLQGYNGHVRLFNGDGTQDISFSPPTFVGNTPGFGGSRLNGIDMMSDGSMIAVGDFSTVNGVATTDIVRLLPAGNVDLTFPGATSNSLDQVRILSGDQILVSGSYPTLGVVIRRYLSNGSLDGTFTMSASVGGVKSNFEVELSGRIDLIGGSGPGSKYYRLESTGVLDSAYNPNATAVNAVSVAAVRADGKVYLAGTFQQMNGIGRSKIARVNADGTLDTSFAVGTGFNVEPSRLVTQPDGRVIAIGGFTNYNGTPKAGFARINNDGTLDPSFSVLVSGVNDVVVQPDGKILLGGSFSTVNGASRPVVARLNSDGTLDTGFNMVIAGSVASIALEPSGKVVISGSFSGVDGFGRANVARLQANGAVDATFDAGSVTANQQIMRQSSGKYVLRNSYVFTRLNASGLADNTFVFPQFNSGASVTTAAVDVDDSIVVSGQFSAVAGFPRLNIARFSPNGELDATFLANGVDVGPTGIIPTPSYKMLLVGNFNLVDLQLRPGIARLNVEPYHPRSAFDFDGDGRADEMVFRPSENYWYLFRSSNSTVMAESFGQTGDIAIPADMTGDGICDMVLFRPSTGDWFWQTTVGNHSGGTAHWGQSGDIPLPADIDQDRKADFVVYRPSNNYWYTYGSITGFTQTQFGTAGDNPLVADFDGDGKCDPTIFRPSSGDWWWRSSIDGVQHALHWGQNGDIPVPADYDGDGKTDCAVFRPSNGVWYVLNSRDLTYTIMQFGLSDDLPVAADFDGDGRADIAVFRPSSGIWYKWRSTSGFAAMQFGAAGDVPAPNAFVP